MLAFGIDHGLRRVDIFGPIIVLHGARAKSERAILNIKNREHNTITETIVIPAFALARNDEPGFLHQLFADTFGFQIF